MAASSAGAEAATAVHRQAQMHFAAHGAAAVDTEAASDRPPQAWPWEQRKRLEVVARRVFTSLLQECFRWPNRLTLNRPTLKPGARNGIVKYTWSSRSRGPLVSSLS